jgi:hypothetical protein
VAGQDFAHPGRIAWVARVEGRPLNLTTADQDRPGLSSLFVLEAGRWRQLVRRTPAQMLTDHLGDPVLAARLAAAPSPALGARKLTFDV